MTLKPLHRLTRLNLKKLIISLVLFSIATLFVISLFVNYFIQRNQLLSSALSVNEEYAHKIATSTDLHFHGIQLELKYSASVLATSPNNDQIIDQELTRILKQSQYFNSVSFVKADGQLAGFAPLTLPLKKGQIMDTTATRLSLKHKESLITPPYNSALNNFLIYISEPVVDASGQYLGFVGGTIYLKEQNFISQLLSSQYGYQDNYMYVLDSQQRIIFHPDPSRIGDSAVGNTGLNTLMNEPSGNLRLVNSKGIDSLAGFSKISAPNWVVISQQPTKQLLDQASNLLYKVILGMLFFYAIVFFVIWRFSYVIAQPLSDLADSASQLNQPGAKKNIRKIRPWYFEVAQFQRALLFSADHFQQTVDELNVIVKTDPLTGFYNRRGMQMHIDTFEKQQTNFAILAIDIDHFKTINDQYGHAEGDRVLQHIAWQIHEQCRDQDICCRIGGEEFIVLLPNASYSLAQKVASRILQNRTQDKIEGIGQVTVSIGIAHWPTHHQSIDQTLQLADQRLYQAKADGRNCIR